MSKRSNKNKSGAPTEETAPQKDAVTNTTENIFGKVAERVKTLTMEDRAGILEAIRELKAILPPGQRGPSEIVLSFPEGQFTFRDVAKRNGCSYATAVDKMKSLLKDGKLVQTGVTTITAKGQGRPKWLFAVPNSTVKS